MRIALVLFGGLGCSGPTDSSLDDTADDGGFCSSIADGGATTTEPIGGNTTSGHLTLRMLTSESIDPYDPLYVAFKDYTLESIDSGGVKTTGKSTGDGLVDVQLGAGNWRFSGAYIRGSLTCLAEIDVLLEPNTTTYACAVMACP